MKKLSVLAVAMAAAFSTTAAIAEVSANIGATSNYLWRGVTQTGDTSSVSGGVDYSAESGVYAGLWTAGLVGGTELDLYLGYAGEAGGLGYDVGYISYQYPNTPAADFAEVYVSVSMDMFSAMYSYDSENKNGYLEAGADLAINEALGLGLHFGSYSMDAGTDYTDYSVSLTKGDFSLTLSDTSENAAYGMSDNMRYAVSWGATF